MIWKKRPLAGSRKHDKLTFQSMKLLDQKLKFLKSESKTWIKILKFIECHCITSFLKLVAPTLIFFLKFVLTLNPKMCLYAPLPCKKMWHHLWTTPRRQGRLPWWLCRCCKGHFGRSPPFFYCCIVLPVWVSQFSCYFPLTYITFTQWDKKMGLVYVHCTTYM